MAANATTLSPKGTITAPLMEMFFSVQGEGQYIGQPQIFVRFARCPLRCVYCDTPESWAVPKGYRVHRGTRTEELSNPASPMAVFEQCRLIGKNARAVSLTGGEPLLYPRFINSLVPRLKAAGWAIHLETAGMLPGALKKLAESPDHISMDWKLSSTLSYGAYRRTQMRFLQLAREGAAREVVVKIVLLPNLASAEFQRAVEDIGCVDAGIPLVLQPVTPRLEVGERPGEGILSQCLSFARGRLQNVYVLPQVHPLLGLK